MQARHTTCGSSPLRSTSASLSISSRRTAIGCMASGARRRTATTLRRSGARSHSRSRGGGGERLWEGPPSPTVDAGARHLVELKARYEDLGKARALLAGSERLGTFRQVDTYFSTGERRLKVRSVEGQREGQLVYYERPDEGGVKESRVLLAPLPEV